MAKVSIIVPVYNSEKFIVNTLESLAHQDHHNLEVILIDDCSEDNTYTLCQEYCHTHMCFTCYRQAGNQGVSAARNRGIDLATGDYCTFVDADDWIEEDLISTQASLIEAAQADVAFAGTIKEKELHPIGVQRFKKLNTAVGKETLIYDFGDIRSRSNPMFTTALIKPLRYDETIISSEDILFDITALSKAGKAIYDPVYRYHYLVHDESVMHKAQDFDYFESGWRAQKKIYEIIYQAELDSKSLYKYYRDYCLSVFGMLRYAAKAGEESLFTDIQREYSAELTKFLRKSDFNFSHKLKYKTYLLPFKLVQMLHGSNKQNVK